MFVNFKWESANGAIFNFQLGDGIRVCKPLQARFKNFRNNFQFCFEAYLNRWIEDLFALHFFTCCATVFADKLTLNKTCLYSEFDPGIVVPSAILLRLAFQNQEISLEVVAQLCLKVFVELIRIKLNL